MALRVKRIVSPLHEPVALNACDAMTRGVPPGSVIAFSWFCAKNATVSESGDQKGDEAPAVPGIGVALSASIGRSHSIRLPVLSTATKASRLPFGDSANRP